MSVELTEGQAAVSFDSFGLGDYDLFLRCKRLPEREITFDWMQEAWTITTPARFAAMLGIQDDREESEGLPLADHLFDYQRFIVQRALDARRYAIWADCVAAETLIDGPDGACRIDELALRGEPFRVWSLNVAGQREAAWASCAFKKGRAPLYEFALADGHSIRVTAHHRFLTPQGWKYARDVSVGSEIASDDSSALRADVPRSMRTAVDSTGRCAQDRRPGDQQPLPAGGSARSDLPLQDDVLEPVPPCRHADDRGHTPSHSRHHRSIGHLSMQDLPRPDNCASDGGEYRVDPSHPTPLVSNISVQRQFFRSANRPQSMPGSVPCVDPDATLAAPFDPSVRRRDCAESLAASLPVAPMPANMPDEQQSALSSLPAPSKLESRLDGRPTESDSEGPLAASFRPVVRIHYIDIADYYDMHVPFYENYSANGFWNHNTGLGKTAMFLEWARHVCDRTHAPVLILSPLQVIPQTIDEATRFYGAGLPLRRLETREELAAWCAAGTGVALCNYEKMIPGVLSELRRLGGLVLDESSILKTGGGVIKWNLIKSARGIDYKLSCTATPAPNDAMEYASQAAFLEKLRNEGEILWTFFRRDKRGNWVVKPHAVQAFYSFMASWSIYLRDPSHYGWQDVLSTLPPADIREYRLSMTEEQVAALQALQVREGLGMFSTERMGVKQRAKQSQLAKGFLYEGKASQRIPSLKPEHVASLVRDELAAGHQVLVWTVFDEEARILKELLGGVATVLDGSTPQKDRPGLIESFRAGMIPCLISKSQLLGYGLNFQHVEAMVFSGFDDSFERMYQAIRRVYRFGQTKTVRVHIPYIPELEGLMFENVRSKETRFEHEVSACEQHYRATLQMEVAA